MTVTWFYFRNKVLEKEQSVSYILYIIHIVCTTVYNY